MSDTIGIDPGLDGAIAIIHGDRAVTLLDTPTLSIAGAKGNKREYDVAEIREVLAGFNHAHVYLERQQAMPASLKGQTQGVVSTFRTGMGYGMWIGLLVGLSMSYEIVAPASWRKAMLKDMPKGKGSSILKAKQLFPSTYDRLKRQKDHGRAEALLIAVYGSNKPGRSVFA